MGNVTYKRGQVEWALWRAFTLARSPGDGPPPIFRTRIKRLLDLDRDLDAAAFGATPPCDFAFVAPAEGGSGVEAQYTPFDAFCLAIALDLLDVGFKQGEIVFLMRHLRDTLADWFDDLLKRPSLIDRQAHLAKHHPGLPVLERSSGRAPIADARVFLILNRIEMTELMPAVTSRAGQAVFLEPEVCEGVTRLQQRLDALMPRHRRTLITLEITTTAQAVAAFLDAAPLVPRGRPRRQGA
ncbi:MAG: hypothetical protein ABL904_21190 [Hyphomicrobiaceae bacterium]